MSDIVLPDFKMSKQKLPVTIMREFATQLGRKTRNLVVGDVHSEQLPGEKILHGFDARAVALGDYTLALFFVTHPLLQPYPARIYLNRAPALKNAGTQYVCDSPEKLTQYLQEVFQIPKVFGTIQSMLDQSQQPEMA